MLPAKVASLEGLPLFVCLCVPACEPGSLLRLGFSGGRRSLWRDRLCSEWELVVPMGGGRVCVLLGVYGSWVGGLFGGTGPCSRFQVQCWFDGRVGEKFLATVCRVCGLVAAGGGSVPACLAFTLGLGTVT
jgi:hypothetical protein